MLFIGAPGVGKTHLAIAQSIKATQAQRRVLFFTAEQLTAQLGAAEVSGRLNHFLDQLGQADLLMIDALGYLSLTKQTARLFFQLVSKRYEKSSIIVTCNKPFEQWGRSSPVMSSPQPSSADCCIIAIRFLSMARAIA
jgi:DNA replication protein DnaC